VNRRDGKRGICGETDLLRVAWAGLHFGEEPPVTGKRGSGTVFFTGCTLGCSFCQNYQISQTGLGGGVSVSELTEMMLGLERQGAENINLVTGTHFVPHIVMALGDAKRKGLAVPVVWNTSGYENGETLKLLEEHIDVYLTDMKCVDSSLSAGLMRARDYPEVSIDAIDTMVGQKRLKIVDGRIEEGVILRHLFLPWAPENTVKFLRLFRKRWYGKALLSLMFQYIPPSHLEGKEELRERVHKNQEERIIRLLDELGIEEGLIHDVEEDNSWEPDFLRNPPFPASLSRTVWHYRGSQRANRIV